MKINYLHETNVVFYFGIAESISGLDYTWTVAESYKKLITL
jgi:hypothetical protein